MLGWKRLDVRAGGVLSSDPGLIARRYIWVLESGDEVMPAALLLHGVERLIYHGIARGVLIVMSSYLRAAFFLASDCRFQCLICTRCVTLLLTRVVPRKYLRALIKCWLSMTSQALLQESCGMTYKRKSRG